ncbi:NagC family transcriptional regulator [Bifidobacterium goeldii]|uniref:NagC family transcriptional regulator n=1 Tax=Bifidobacterium goeldii TaxID=2306975 RepID=A0A430FN45_9BIFI|nr:ROK family protein [Bifidobacterium goeldii]RSX54248.1 NagC family transcriptional regulator [Bifidobacterium goeldii]
MTASRRSGIWALHTPDRSAKASPADVRRINRSLIFSLLFPDHQYSRAEIGRRTGLSRVAVSDVVNDMLDCGLLRENGQESNSGKGKRGTLLSVDTTRLNIISIDMSQPHLIQGAVTNLLGIPTYRAEAALNAVDHVTIEMITSIIEQLLNHAGDAIGIGIAAPGVVDEEGVVRRSTLFGWEDLDLRSPIEQHFGIRVTVDNDATCAMLTERFFGQGGPNMLFVRISRGIGGAVLIDDVPVIGEYHAGGEIGHISLDPQGPPCACGKRGCLERLISATSLRARMQHASLLERTQILRQAGTYLATALSMPVGLLDMADVCVYGQPDIVNDDFLTAAQRRFDQLTGSSFHTRTIIRRCQCGGDITLRGEALSVLHNYLESL